LTREDKISLEKKAVLAVPRAIEREHGGQAAHVVRRATAHRRLLEPPRLQRIQNALMYAKDKPWGREAQTNCCCILGR
jgi:hypothetical protein